MNYEGNCRTNYFGVKNESEFREIISRLVGDEMIRIFTCETDKSKFAFGGGIISGIRPKNYKDEDYDEDDIIDGDEWLYELQKVVADDDAIIVTEVGREGYRYIDGSVTVITSRNIEFKDLRSTAFELARKALGNPNWDTRDSY